MNIPKESSSIKETNFAWVKKNEKNPITSFSFLTKKNQKTKTDELSGENQTETQKTEIQTGKTNSSPTLEREFKHMKCMHTRNWYDEETTDMNMKEIVKEQNIEKSKRDFMPS